MTAFSTCREFEMLSCVWKLAPYPTRRVKSSLTKNLEERIMMSNGLEKGCFLLRF